METLPQYKEKCFSKLEDLLGFKFTKKNTLVQAFVHRSYLNENRDFPLAHNERLEFLGDAVLELVVTKHLFEHYLNPEGDLTNWRAALVNSKMCSTVAREIGMEEYLFLSHGESKDTNIKARDYILANALEALIGAIYIDQGYEYASQFIMRWIVLRLPLVLEEGSWMDPKSRFQESAQDIVGVTPTYKVLDETGPDHDKTFTVGVYLGREEVAQGTGGSKQEAQIDAAANGFATKKWKGVNVEILERNEDDPLG